MKLYGFVLIILLVLVFVPDYYIFNKLKKNNKPKLALFSLLPAVFFVMFFLYLKFWGRGISDYRITSIFMWINYVFLLIFVPKMLYVLVRGLRFLLAKIFKKYTFWVMSVFAWLLAAVTFFVFLIGAFVTPNNFEVKHTELAIHNLPKAFDGYKIIQISDIHLGSFGANTTKLNPIVELINQQDVDLLVFTGDMVNNYADEANGWDPVFTALKAKDGKFAILGNHDYGDYSDWPSEASRLENRNGIAQRIEAFGFTLLRNEHVHLRRGTDSIALAGVENWGKPPFPKYGDLAYAMQSIESDNVVLLLSHDPSHWQAEVLNYPNIKLTLSGHTHAAQFMFRWFGRNVSPSAWVYRNWDGLYSNGNQHLYINRGLGYVGLPMRIGARPEISVLTLRSR